MLQKKVPISFRMGSLCLQTLERCLQTTWQYGTCFCIARLPNSAHVATNDHQQVRRHTDATVRAGVHDLTDVSNPKPPIVVRRCWLDLSTAIHWNAGQLVLLCSGSSVTRPLPAVSDNGESLLLPTPAAFPIRYTIA